MLAHAETSPPRLPTDATLARLIDESLDARPELRKAAAVIDAESERVPQVGSLPDPMLQIGWQNDGFTSIGLGRMENSYISLMVSQSFPWAGKRGLRQGVAELEVTQARLAVARLRLSTEADVRRAYLDLVLVRDRLALLERLQAIWDKSLGVARARYEAGDGAQSDVLRSQLELNRIKQRRIALQAEERTRLQNLNRLRAHPLGESIVTPAHVQDLPEPGGFASAFSVDDALARSPELAMARLGVRRTDQTLALAEKSYYPDLEVGAGIMIRGELPPMWLVTVGGPLPLFSGRRQDRSVAENRAWAIAAKEEVASIEQVLRLRTEERRTAFQALVETIDLYKQGLLVQSEATADSTLSQYKVGKLTFASVLEANAGFIADQEGYLQAIAAAYRILIAEVEISLSPTAVMSAGGVGAGAAMPGAGSSSMEPSGGTSDSAVNPGAATGGSASSM